MRRLIFAYLAALATAFAQPGNVATPAPSATASPAASPTGDADLDYARQFGAVVLETLYAGEYAAVADMMNPNPPLWKGSQKELHQARSGDLANMAMARAAYGLRLKMECTHAARVSRPKRPSTEEFFELTYRSTYGDKLTATDLLTIIKKEGKFYVERFR